MTAQLLRDLLASSPGHSQFFNDVRGSVCTTHVRPPLAQCHKRFGKWPNFAHAQVSCTLYIAQPNAVQWRPLGENVVMTQMRGLELRRNGEKQLRQRQERIDFYQKKPKGDIRNNNRRVARSKEKGSLVSGPSCKGKRAGVPAAITYTRAKTFAINRGGSPLMSHIIL